MWSYNFKCPDLHAVTVCAKFLNLITISVKHFIVRYKCLICRANSFNQSEVISNFRIYHPINNL